MAGNQPLVTVGVGASAGGLEALLAMFASMEQTGRMAYIVAQHMAKDGHDALMVRLMARGSTLPVVLAQEGVLLTADTVFLIPAGKDGRVAEGRLCLTTPVVGSVSTPSVNVLFQSIAESQQSNGAGVVLSGTGSDGALGCRAIRARGGVTIAQDPHEAKFDGMPLAAVALQQTDRVLPAAQIAAQLSEWFPGRRMTSKQHSPATTVLREPDADVQEADPARRELAQLLPQILAATRIDFSKYKEDTLVRRLAKRKAELGVVSADDYQKHIYRHPEELHALQHIFLVSLSSFFRDCASFNVLKTSLAGLVANKPPAEPVRVWVPGCASGEEVFTIAIVLRELDGTRRIDIIGTDLNPDALNIAYAASYRQTAFKEIDPRLLAKYFSNQGDHRVVEPGLQACVTFERRNVLEGSPPGTFDLVSCRNLLIYMKSALQDQLMSCFHRALAVNGLLFIGQSESLSFSGTALFTPVDHDHRVYRRRA